MSSKMQPHTKKKKKKTIVGGKEFRGQGTKQQEKKRIQKRDLIR